MGWILFTRVISIITLLGSTVALRHYLHMFQLNTYKPNVQRQWQKKNWRQGCKLLIPVFGGFLFCPRREAKISLKYTARVKRMLATVGVITAVIYATAWLLKIEPALWLWQIFLPEILLLANWINRPIEKAIRKHYTKDAMQKLDSHKNLIVIGITGSYGKTSMKHFLNTLLRAKYNVLMTPGNINTPMGVVKVIREELNASHEIFLCEMGAKNVGDIKELCSIVRPKYGVLTSIGPQHLESFFTIENVISTKFELADALPANGMLFANAGNAYIAENLSKYANVTAYNGTTFCAQDIAVSECGTSFTLTTPNGEERFETRLIGEHNVVNLAGAIAAAHFLGVPMKQLRSEMRKIAPVPHRLELIDRGGTLVLDDSYNSNPAGAKAALDVLAMLAGEKILVTPGMIELGPEQETLNRQFGAQAAAICGIIVLVGAAQTKPIYEGVLEAGFARENLFVVETLQEGMRIVHAMQVEDRKVILLENDLPDNF